MFEWRTAAYFFISVVATSAGFALSWVLVELTLFFHKERKLERVLVAVIESHPQADRPPHLMFAENERVRRIH